MTRAFVSRRHARLNLFIGIVLLFAFLTAGCCPPALLDRTAKKLEKTNTSSPSEKPGSNSNK